MSAGARWLWPMALTGGWLGGQHGGMRSAVGVYCVIVGAFMVVWWIIDIRRGALMRPDRSRPEIMLHLAAELVTAALLVAGGALLSPGGNTGVALVGLGALLYTVINSPGYFLARRERAPVIMFAVLFALTATAIGGLLAT